MSKEEMLRMMRLLSALESAMMCGQKAPPYLIEELGEMVGVLEREILK